MRGRRACESDGGQLRINILRIENKTCRNWMKLMFLTETLYSSCLRTRAPGGEQIKRLKGARKMKLKLKG